MAKEYLDKTGLTHFWDNIKGEIGNASDAQVDDWLDRHPEATTTVQDGAITTAKLANGAVTDTKLAQSGGVLDKVGALEYAFDVTTEQIDKAMPDLIGNQIINPTDYEIGGIYAPDSPPWNYEYSAKRVRTKEGFSYKVKKGDKVFLSSYTDAEFFAFVENDTEYRRDTWRTSGEFVVPFDGDLRFTLRYQEEKVLDTSDFRYLVSLVRITGTNGTKQQSAKNAENINNIFARIDTIDGIVNADIDDFEIGTIYIVNGSQWSYYWSPNKVRTKEGVTYNIPAGGKIGLSTYVGWQFIVGYRVNNIYFSSGILQSDFVLPVDAECVIVVTKAPEETVDDYVPYVDKVRIRTKEQTGNKNYSGDKIVTNNNGYTWMAQSVFNIPATSVIAQAGFTVSSMQSFAYYGGYFVIGYSDDVLAICNAYDGTVVNIISAEVGHVNNMSFGDTFYDQNDAFPLLYVTTTVQAETTVVKVIRLASSSSATTIKTLTFNGNYGTCAIDKMTGNMIVVTYNGNSPYVAENNQMTVRKYDISGNTPILLNEHQIEHIPVCQDAEIINGMMFIASYGLNSTPATQNKIYVIDTNSLIVRNILTEFDNYYANINENEGVTFMNGDLCASAGTSTRKAIFID